MAGKAAIFLVGSESGGPVAVVDTQDAYAVHRVTDRYKRRAFEQSVIERDLAIGGLERNDELDLWAERHHAVQQLRGTTRGILLEARRIAASNDDVQLVPVATPGEWFLEVTWPDVSPIWLELDAMLSHVCLEIPADTTPNWTLEDLGAWIARHLLPRSTVELSYSVAVATTVTAPSSLLPSGDTRLQVTSTRGFDAGDLVTIRSEDSEQRLEGQVVAVQSSTELDLTHIGTVATGAVIRRTLARS